MRTRVWILVGAAIACAVGIFLFPRIPQNEAYHHFADQRAWLGVPNCLDSLSNVFFLVVGALGILFVARSKAPSDAFIDSKERWPYLLFFLAVALTAFGSAYYHLAPSDERLVWDRLPMSFGFASLLGAVIAERISVRAGLRLLLPLLIFGAGSVLYWNYTQERGQGDLRAYVLTQFGFLLMLVLLVALFAPRYTRGGELIVSLGIYALAKGSEALDRPIFAVGGIVSGHTLKHVAAAVSAYWILRMLRRRGPMAQNVSLPVS